MKTSLSDQHNFPVTGCFAAGTLIQTMRGWIPIEQVQVGDKVLTQGNGGKGYEWVTKTFTYPDQDVCLISIYPKEDSNLRVPRVRPLIAEYYVGTDTQPFWVNGIGWVKACDLQDEDEILLYNDQTVSIRRARPIYRTKEPNIGWWECQFGQGLGRLIHLGSNNSQANIGIDTLNFNESVDWQNSNARFKSTLYGFEIKDSCTFYIGTAGTLVYLGPLNESKLAEQRPKAPLPIEYLTPYPCGFVAGTLVHTESGLIPIQEIKIGDHILSRSKNDGTMAYKPVTKVEQYPQEVVCLVGLYPKDELEAAEKEERDVREETRLFLVGTDNQLAYIEQAGYVRKAWADYANREPELGWEQILFLKDEDLKSCKENALVADGAKPIYITLKTNAGFATSDRMLEFGEFVYLDNNLVQVEQDYDKNEALAAEDGAWLTEDEERLLRTVYNLEVEDFNTYFVTEAGIWTHCKAVVSNSAPDEKIRV